MDHFPHAIFSVTRWVVLPDKRRGFTGGYTQVPPRATIFMDREDAGRQLAGLLSGYRDEDATVLALPRGGVPVGYEIARLLKAPLDVFVARKLGAPGRPELAIGAIAPGGVRIINERVVRQIGVPEGWIEAVSERELAEVGRRMRRFRGGGAGPEIRGRTVILVDDGIATGMTVRAAIQAIRKDFPRRIVLAVPVCAGATADELNSEVDELVCLQKPADLWAIGFWYENFHQLEDEEVLGLLGRSHREN
ncbi:MAG: phosphoribosyltransferase [Rubrobacteraceae bacterium]